MALIAANTTLVLASLRQLMVLSTITPNNLSAYIIPFVDAHQGENIAECDERLKFISGFSGVGSTGLAIVTMDKAILWTDSRYAVRAAEELDDNWEVMMGNPANLINRIGTWLVNNLSEGDYVGVDPFLLSYSSWESLSVKLFNNRIYLSAVERNLVDFVWESQGRPSCTRNPIFSLEAEYSGKQTHEKVYDVRMNLRTLGLAALIISELDEIAWLLNIRGNDIQFCPTFRSYVLLTRNTFWFFINETQLDESVKTALELQIPEIQFKDYDSVLDAIEEFGLETGGKVMFNAKTSYAIGNLIPDSRQYIQQYTPISLMKAVKNEMELSNMEKALIKDAAAICVLLSWIENSLDKNKIVTELSASKKLAEIRTEFPSYLKDSIETMSASGPNAALGLYQPRPTTNRRITTQEIYLLEAGGQYFEGTTDQSRTVHFGSPSDEEKDRYTRILKGQIALQETSFKIGTSHSRLRDILYQFLEEIDIGLPPHASGHGIGAFLHMEEGPSSIGGFDTVDFAENMIMTNEPGVYNVTAGYGIRNENVMKITRVSETDLGFEILTFLPYQRELMDLKIMTASEVEYINQYHSQVRKIIGNFIRDNQMPEIAYNWLVRETMPIDLGTTLIPTSTTEASTTEASTTEVSTTEASTTEASTTEASTTEASTTEASTTEASTTEASTTEASTTEASTTKAPTTAAPTTEASTTEASTTEASTTAASTTEGSTTPSSSNLKSVTLFLLAITFCISLM